jgi:hypothetical protein
MAKPRPRKTFIPEGTAQPSPFEKFNVGWFYEACWKATIHLLWPVTPKQIEGYLKRNYAINEYRASEDAAGRCIEIESTAGHAHIICLTDWTLDPKHISILSHECLHATEQILSKRGIILGDTTSEAFCHLQDSLLRRCLDLILHKKLTR